MENAKMDSPTCEVCGKCFKSRGDMNKHIFHTHSGIKPYKCSWCGKTSSIRNNIVVHERMMHTGEKPFQCDQCDKAYASKAKLSNHIRGHTGEKPYKCEFCPKRFKLSGQRSIHARIHTNDKRYRCNPCNKSFIQYATLFGHMRSVHSDKRPFECKKCDICFKRKGELEKHGSTVHAAHREESFHCHLCGKNYTTKSGLDIHMKRIHIKDDINECYACEKVFYTKGELKQHVTVIHVGETKVKCDVCEKTISKRYMNIHMRTHGENRELFPCRICDHISTTKHNLKTHEESMHGEKLMLMVHCEVCQKEILKRSLEGHMKTHMVDREQFRCTLCGKDFTSKRGLKYHAQKHCEKLHKCKLCEAVFLENISLEKHLQRVHGK